MIIHRWMCYCKPHSAVFRGRGGPKLVLVHGINCDKPWQNRPTVTVKMPKQSVPFNIDLSKFGDRQAC